MVGDPQASDLWRLIDQHFDSFQQVYDERYQAKYGYDRGDPDAWRAFALASAHPRADHLRSFYTRGRFSGVAPVRRGSTAGRLAGRSLRVVLYWFSLTLSFDKLELAT